MLKSYHHGHHHYLQQFLLFRFVLILLDFVLNLQLADFPFYKLLLLFMLGSCSIIREKQMNYSFLDYILMSRVSFRRFFFLRLRLTIPITNVSPWMTAAHLPHGLVVCLCEKLLLIHSDSYRLPVNWMMALAAQSEKNAGGLKEVVPLPYLRR